LQQLDEGNAEIATTIVDYGVGGRGRVWGHREGGQDILRIINLSMGINRQENFVAFLVSGFPKLEAILSISLLKISLYRLSQSSVNQKT
jgi:hypothetical protein